MSTAQKMAVRVHRRRLKPLLAAAPLEESQVSRSRRPGRVIDRCGVYGQTLVMRRVDDVAGAGVDL